MRQATRFIAAIFGVAAVLASCTKEALTVENEKPFVFPSYLPSNTDQGQIDEEIVTLNRSYSVTFPSQKVCEWTGFTDVTQNVYVYSPEENVKNLIDIHLEILPIYVFGTENSAGDYYAIQGYVVSHNASAFSDSHTIFTKENQSHVEMMGWYMSDLGLDLQLLDDKGNAVNNDDVTFFVTPEPSTTIGSTTYVKGFSFTFAPALTFGAQKVDPQGQDPGGWKGTLLGNVSFGFGWTNTSSQNLPDQSVMMSTGPQDRKVMYHFKTNNVKESMTSSDIPSIFRNDQRADFSFVWNVRSGAYHAIDNDFGNMKMRVTVTPQYKANFSGKLYANVKEKDDKGKEREVTYIRDVKEYGRTSTNVSSVLDMDLPSINRIPIGSIMVKNCTSSYMTNMQIYRHGEYSKTRIAYSSPEGTCDTNESIMTLLREGTYDIVYELKNGDTGESRGLFMIEGVEIKSGDDLTRTTFDGKRVSE